MSGKISRYFGRAILSNSGPERGPHYEAPKYFQKNSHRPGPSGSKRIVILSPYCMAIDLDNQLFKITFFLHEVDIIGVNDQKRRIGIVKEEIIE